MKANARISKTAMLALVKALDWKAIGAALRVTPELLEFRSKRGENYLHVCCGVNVAERGLPAAGSIRSAGVLIEAGLDVNGEAFREGEWKATPLWYAVARGKNLKLAKYLLGRGASPEHCLWAAAYNDDPAAVRLLVGAGATIDAVHDDGDTPLLFAVRWSRFAAVAELLRCGADPNYRDRSGNSALHYLLKKRAARSHVQLLIDYGARPDR